MHREVDTSPMPEDAPVMSMTFPVTFCRNSGFMVDRRNLKNRYGGRKKRSEVRPMGGTTMYSTVLMISMAFFCLTEKLKPEH